MAIREKFKVGADDPFENDKLNRKRSCELLSELVKTFPTPSVICINASWGFGKTTFIELWRSTLKHEQYHSIYFNSWENDFSTDPFIAFISTFQEYFQTTIHKNNNKAIRLLDTSIDFANRAIEAYNPALIKAASAGLIEIPKDGLLSSNEFALVEFLGKAGKLEIQKYAQRKSAFNGLKHSLGSFLIEIEGSNYSKPVIIFIDELDRCRPTYAIELLEVIKHVFNVPGLLFVLAMDSDQLSHSVKALYGNDFNAKGYLKRFVDYTYNLPEPERGEFVNSLFDRTNFKEIAEIRKLQGLSLQKAKDWTSYLSRAYRLSMRDSIQCVEALSIICRVMPKHLAPYLHYAAWLSIAYHQEFQDQITFDNLKVADKQHADNTARQASANARPNNLITLEIEFHLSRAFGDDDKIDQRIRKFTAQLSELRANERGLAPILSESDRIRKTLLQELINDSKLDVHSSFLEVINFALSEHIGTQAHQNNTTE